MRLIVVEGPDSSGKSTLIENLRHSTDRYFWLLKPSGPPGSLESLGKAIYLATLLASGLEKGSFPPLVMDRHPLISDPIYSISLGRKNLASGSWERSEAQELLKHQVERIIYCRPHIATIIGTFKGRQLSGVFENLPVIIEGYDRMMLELAEEYGIPVIRYDWTMPSINRTYDDLFFGDL